MYSFWGCGHKPNGGGEGAGRALGSGTGGGARPQAPRRNWRQSRRVWRRGARRGVAGPGSCRRPRRTRGPPQPAGLTILTRAPAAERVRHAAQSRPHSALVHPTAALPSNGRARRGRAGRSPCGNQASRRGSGQRQVPARTPRRSSRPRPWRRPRGTALLGAGVARECTRPQARSARRRRRRAAERALAPILTRRLTRAARPAAPPPPPVSPSSASRSGRIDLPRAWGPLDALHHQRPANAIGPGASRSSAATGPAGRWRRAAARAGCVTLPPGCAAAAAPERRSCVGAPCVSQRTAVCALLAARFHPPHAASAAPDRAVSPPPCPPPPAPQRTTRGWKCAANC